MIRRPTRSVLHCLERKKPDKGKVVVPVSPADNSRVTNGGDKHVQAERTLQGLAKEITEPLQPEIGSDARTCSFGTYMRHPALITVIPI